MTEREAETWIASPEWLLAGFDLPAERYAFAGVGRETYSRSVFLDHRIEPRPKEVRSAGADAIDRALSEHRPPAAGWIFHTAFCASTLLATCLDRGGESLVLKEPKVLSQLADALRAGNASEQQIARVLLLNERPFRREPVIIKPSNHANALLSAVLAPESGRRVLLMGSSLRSLLVSLLKKREEAERLLPGFTAVLSSDAPRDLRAQLPEILSLPLLHTGVVFWLVQRCSMAGWLNDGGSGTVRSLTMETFLNAPQEVLSEVSGWFGLGMGEREIDRIVTQGAFRRHSKGAGRAYDSSDQQRERRAIEMEHGAAIDDALRWAQPLLDAFPPPEFVNGENWLDGDQESR